MEVNKDRAKAAQDCLDFNKHLKTVHVTSDLECFPIKNDAVNHARTLEDKTVDIFNRDEDGDAEHDIVDTYLGTQTANAIPDADLAKAKKAGAAKGQAFAKTPKAPVKDPAAKYGTEGEDSGKPKKAAASKKAPKKAAEKKAEDPKQAIQPAAETEPEASQAAQSTDPSTGTENQQ